MRRFVEHNERVMATIPADRLLVLDLSKGEGWGPLCAFLGLPEPAVPFPHVNDTAEFEGIVNKVGWVGGVIGTLGLGIPFLLAPGPPAPVAAAKGQEENQAAPGVEPGRV